MIKSYAGIFLIIYFAISFKAAWGLVPIESLLLGNFSENYSENESDPLNYVFTYEKLRPDNKSYKRELAMFRGFYEEGKNMVNFCKTNHEIRYTSEWDKIQVKRSVLSEIQYIGLDITSRAIPQYAKALEFSRDEYSNLINGLVGNYCSSNLSIISKKELINNFIVKFDKENNFNLPSVKKNPYFPDNMESYFQAKTSLEQEFKYTVKLFQSICSWGGNPTNPGLMVSIIKNPALMSFFIRQMNNQVIDWKETTNTLYLKEDKKTVQVWCDNLICRKTTSENFFHKINYSVGGSNFGEDLKRLYCEDFIKSEYRPNESDDRLRKIMNTRTFDEENFINSQFIALLTGIPDFLLKAEKFTKGEDLFRASVDFTWSKWARSQTELLNKELYFEEPLSLELVSRVFYFNPKKAELKVSLDANLGEFDRINQRTGKIRASFKIFIQKSFLHYYREALNNLDPLSKDKGEKERLLNRFKIQMSKDISNARLKFIIPPWKGDLEQLLAGELTEQIRLISNPDFLKESKGFEIINIDINYGIFALKYINHQKSVENSRSKISEQISK